VSAGSRMPTALSHPSHGVAAEFRKLVALTRVAALTAWSYRLNMVLSLGGLVFSMVPLFFVAEALQPMAGPSIADEGERYFGFLVVGLAVTSYIGFAMRSIPSAIAGGISSGTLEALFATPTRLSVLLAGMVGYPFLRTTAQALIMLAAILVVGVSIVPSGIPVALPVLALLLVAHTAVGLVAAALHLVFRTSGPLVGATLALSTLLGGVYYSTSVIPNVIQPLSHVIPLTYGLRAMRRSLLQGEPLSVLAPDIGILLALTAALFAVGIVSFRLALRHARRAGTLAQY
jgi:ABC-2 type transport system permease protein